jgi:ACS family hexuronate transporter-like MFS transporter
MKPIRNLRWYICGLLFFATTINYIDRQVLGLLKPVLESELGWSEAEYGWIVFSFQLSYALVMPLAGRFIDWVGTRLGYLLAVVVWSIAAMAHALAGSAGQFGIARFALGIGEAANFPAALKTIADWFPQKERALATGIFNSGSNIGAIVAPLVVPWIAATWGWREAFLITGALGFIWVILWMLVYRDPRQHARISTAELALIEAGRESEGLSVRIPFTALLTKRQAWAFAIGKFLTDPVWWFYLYWLPGFLNKQYGLKLTELGLPLIAIYLAADVSSIGGGWLSSALLARGWSVNSARKGAMLVCALCVTSAIFVASAGANVWLAVTLISIAAASHQGWSANMFTLATDLFPRRQMGAIIGFGGMAGAIGGLLVAPAIGYWLAWSNSSYGPLFVVAGTMYLLALGIIHVLVPNLEEAKIS